MNWISRHLPIASTAGILGVFLLAPNSLAQGPSVQKYKRSDVDMPVSLAIGTVRTPEFAVKHEAYFIMIQVEKPATPNKSKNPLPDEELRPFQQLACMMGIAGNVVDCSRDHVLLRADWTVWDGDRIAQQGSDQDHPAGMFENKHMYKIFGPFMGELGKKYVVEMKFVRDASPLNVANPHLIVI